MMFCIYSVMISVSISIKYVIISLLWIDKYEKNNLA